MRRLYGLDALRGIAALIVFEHHAIGVYGVHHNGLPAVLSVDLFFMLSGFVLDRVYCHRFGMNLRPAQFLLLRYRRLMPALMVGTLGGLIFYAVTDRLTGAVTLSLLTTITFLPALWIPRFLFPLNWPAWSLSSEIFSNLVHSIFARARPTMLLAVFAPAYLITEFALGAPVIGMTLPTLVPSLFRAGTAYFVGVQLRRSFGDRPLPVPPEFGIVVFVAAAYGLPLLPPSIAGICFMFIAAPLAIRCSVGMPKRVWAIAVGFISYPLYAVHAPVIQLCHAFNLPLIVAAAVALCIAVTVALLCEPGSPLRSRRPAPSEHSGQTSQIAV